MIIIPYAVVVGCIPSSRLFLRKDTYLVLGGFSVGERCCCTVAACRDPIKMLRSSFVHEIFTYLGFCRLNKLLLLWVAACRDRTTLRLYVVSKHFPVQGIYLVVAAEVV